jgi:CRP/FNR family cyclic AMP-dependent transcriptional regulator
MMPGKVKRAVFDPMKFLVTVHGDRIISKYQADQRVFSQGDIADAVFYIQSGRVKISVVSEQGKEAVVAVLGPDTFFGEGYLADQARRIGNGRGNDAMRDHAVGEGRHYPYAP